MHPILEAAEQSLELDLASLRTAAAATERRREQASQAARDFLTVSKVAESVALDIVAFGSIARDEMAPGSDFDWLVVAHRYSENPEDFVQVKKAAIEARKEISAEKEGPSGIFGTLVGATGLVNSIGLDVDTNLSHTRRILMLEESVSLLKYDEHRALRQAITARYLHDQATHDAGVPRFLLNDVIRYWRTVAVDYQAKRWEEVEGEKWGLRLLKLRSTRKLTFAGTVVSLLLPALQGRRPDPDGLTDQWEMPPLARLAQLHDVVGPQGQGYLREILQLADQFAGWLQRDDFRQAAKGVDHLRSAPVGSELREAYSATRALNEALMSLFFCDEAIHDCPHPRGLQSLAHHYLVF